MQFVNLNTGAKMPQLGYGVYQTPIEETERCVREAIEVGYRSIDTAQAYHNEEGVGKAIKGCGLDRSELFITTKIWISNYGYENAKASIDRSLEKLQTEYVDLFLLHQPFGDYYGAYRALEEAFDSGKAKAIGVSNFYPDRFVDIAHFSRIKPAVNQVETHVFCQQRQIRKYLAKTDTKLMSWGPFAEGKNNYFTNPTLVKIGEAHGKTAAQTALRFMLQDGVILIPKSTHKNRMEQNFDVFDFELNSAEIAEIQSLDLGHSLFFDHHDPEVVERFMGWASSHA